MDLTMPYDDNTVELADFGLRRIEDVPRWHFPFRCDLWAGWVQANRPDEEDHDIDAFDAWLAEHPDRIHDCGYHQDDWPEGMRLAITVYRRLADELGPNSTIRRETLRAAIQRESTVTGEAERGLAESLFLMPIVATHGNPQLTDGQHRMCTMRTAGLHEVLVLVC